jgi:hypothetical protein
VPALADEVKQPISSKARTGRSDRVSRHRRADA